MRTLKLIQIGDSVGLILPPEDLERLRLKPGQSVYLTEMAGAFVLSVSDPALAEQLEAGRALMREYPDSFDQLAN